jgi:hypothetical protein
MLETAVETKEAMEPKSKTKNMDAKIPGLDITWQQAQELEWTKEFITSIQSAKKQFNNVNVINCADAWFVIRSLNRREYRNLVQTQAEAMAKEVEAAADSANPEGVRATLNMMSEEAIAVQGTVYPAVDLDSLRGMASGVATTLHDSILAISGYQSAPTPIKV